jgi:O-antigen ligase
MDTDLRRPSPGRYLLEWINPALFALLVSATVRFHSLVPGPTMPRMVGGLLALAALALLVLVAMGRRLHPPRDIGLLLLAFAGSAAVSVLGSGGTDLSMVRLGLYFAMAFLATAVYLLHRDAATFPVEGYLLGIAIVHLPFLLAAILWIKDLSPPFWQQYGLRVAHFAHVRQFGEFGFFAAVSATALGVLSKRLVLPAFLLGTAAVFGIVLTGCRGATLAWIFFVLLACCFSRARLRAALLGAMTLAAGAGLVWYLDDSGLLRSPNIFSRVALLAQGEGPQFDSGRIPLWIASIKQVFAHPFFGSGPEGYWLSGCCDRTILQAHNFILQFLMEFGFVGCGLLGVVMFRTAARLGGATGLWRLTREAPANRLLACVLAAYLAYSLIDQMMYHLLPLLFFALFAGLFAAGLMKVRAAATAAA